MNRKKETTPKPIHNDSVIHLVRGDRVTLAIDPGRIYGIPTFTLNEAVRRDGERFPDDFMIQLRRDESEALTSQTAISKRGRGGRRTLPYAFTVPLGRVWPL